MRRKLVQLLLALGAMGAFALAPTVASASPVMTSPLGTSLATGSLLQVTNVGISLFTEPAGRIECSNVKFTGELKTNSGAEVAVNLSSMEAHGSGAGGDCTSGGGSVKVAYSGLPWCFKTTGKDEFQIRGGSCTGIKQPVTFVITYTGAAECKYEALSFHGFFSTAPEDVRMTISEQLFETEPTNGIFCPTPSIGSDTEMTMEKDSPTNEPVYIS